MRKLLSRSNQLKPSLMLNKWIYQGQIVDFPIIEWDHLMTRYWLSICLFWYNSQSNLTTINPLMTPNNVTLKAVIPLYHTCLHIVTKLDFDSRVKSLNLINQISEKIWNITNKTKKKFFFIFQDFYIIQLFSRLKH